MLPIRYTVYQYGVKDEEYELANKYTGSETLNSLVLAEGKGKCHWDSNDIVADYGHIGSTFLNIKGPDDALSLRLQTVEEEADKDYRHHLNQ